MKSHNKLAEIYSHPEARAYLEGSEVRPWVRKSIEKVSQCRTLACGALVYKSENERLILYLPCKSPACPSCGRRRILHWLRLSFAALPETLYQGVTFSMPDVLWSIFRENRELMSTLPALAADVLKAWARANRGLEIGVTAIPHTFNGELNFNSHVHTMVTGGGWKGGASYTRWIFYNRDQIMRAWRSAVIDLLRTALRAGVLRTNMTIEDIERMFTQVESRKASTELLPTWRASVTDLANACRTSGTRSFAMAAEQIELMLAQQEKLWWSVNFQSFNDKMHFFLYAGRYAMRPPIAQRRIVSIGEMGIVFWFKKKVGTGRKRRYHKKFILCSIQEFVRRLSQHLRDRYQHGVRNFGLFSPQSIPRTRNKIFASLGQTPRRRPRPRTWAESIEHCFGHNPLLDSKGQRMKRARRIPPRAA